MATLSSSLAWKIPWTEKPGELQSIEYKESDMTEWLSAQVSEQKLKMLQEGERSQWWLEFYRKRQSKSITLLN